MKVNPLISKVISEISAESVRLANNPTAHYKYVRRILRAYDKTLNEEDRIFVMNQLLEMIHYKNATLDPDNMFTAANIRFRSWSYLTFLIIVVMIIAAILLKTNSGLNLIVDYLDTIRNAISLGKGN